MAKGKKKKKRKHDADTPKRFFNIQLKDGTLIGSVDDDGSFTPELLEDEDCGINYIGELAPSGAVGFDPDAASADYWDDDYEDRIPEAPAANPKIQAGSKKVSLSVIPPQVLAELALAMMEGARKYGPYNWRKGGTVASTYYDAAMRHMISYWEGDDYDPEAGCLHLVKAIASLVVLVDSILQENVLDNRPAPAKYESWLSDANKRVEAQCPSTSQKTTGN